MIFVVIPDRSKSAFLILVSSVAFISTRALRAKNLNIMFLNPCRT